MHLTGEVDTREHHVSLHNPKANRTIVYKLVKSLNKGLFLYVDGIEELRHEAPRSA